MKKVKLTAGLILWLMLGATLISCTKKEDFFLDISGEKIAKEEYAIWAYDNVSKVAVEFTHKYEVDANEAGFWEQTYDNITPMDRLKELTNQVMLKEKGVQILAKQFGILEDTGYDAFLRAFEQENTSRQEKTKNGEVVYGPEQLSLHQYYSYRQGQIETFVKEHIETNIIKIDDKELQEFYTTLEQKESKKNFKSQLFFCVWDNSLDENIRDTIELRFFQLCESNNLTEERVKALAEELQVDIISRTETISTLELGKENLEYDNVVSEVYDLEPEDLSERFFIGAGYEGIVKVLTKEYEEFGTFEANEAYVVQMYKSDKATEYIENESNLLKLEIGKQFQTLSYEDIIKQ